MLSDNTQMELCNHIITSVNPIDELGPSCYLFIWSAYQEKIWVTTVRITTTYLCFVDGALDVSLLFQCCAIIKCDQESSDTVLKNIRVHYCTCVGGIGRGSLQNRRQDRLTHIGLKQYTVYSIPFRIFSYYMYFQQCVSHNLYLWEFTF